MYWPIGAPNIYALTKYDLPPESLQTSNDGLEPTSQDATPPTPSPLLNPDTPSRPDAIIATAPTRTGTLFLTITRTALTIWQTKPVLALTGVVRSPQSLNLYGPNTTLFLTPDGHTLVLQTAAGYLITYTINTDASAKVYQTHVSDVNRRRQGHAARGSDVGSSGGSGGGGAGLRVLRRGRGSASNAGLVAGEGEGIREVHVRFRMVIRIDAGISRALAFEEELVVATLKPAAVQCIRWAVDGGEGGGGGMGIQSTSTELVSRMEWIGRRTGLVEMVFDRPMNLSCWITSDGRAYAVQRRKVEGMVVENNKSLFQGFCFREPEMEGDEAVKIAINARFSLIAVGCARGTVDVYAVKDYMGNIPLSHKLSLPAGGHGKITFLSYSPDGCCLLVGFEKCWAIWSVYGKLVTNTLSIDQSLATNNGDIWLGGITSAFWSGNGSELALLPINDNRLWTISIARHALTGCFSAPNISRGLLQSSDSIMLYRGHDVADVMSLAADVPSWHTVQIPLTYLAQQWPIKITVISSDGRYVAVAGKRGLAHYSVLSSKWKTFDDLQAENEFVVRGGMCWHYHILVAAVESAGRFQLRLYSREKSLSAQSILHIEQLSAPAISTTVSGSDSLLVYTHDNTLLHYIIAMGGSSPRLVHVGQIGFHGIIRAPTRVRAISWILPDAQLEDGDPSQDVARATVLFLVDGKLVLLQPSTNEHGELKYDMRVIAQNVEHYLLIRDQPSLAEALPGGHSDAEDAPFHNHHLGHSLRDSLWYFDGSRFRVWSDIQDIMACAPAELGRDLPSAVAVPADFYPLSAIVPKGIIFGIEADLVQRRDVDFAFFRHAPRTQLFLPQLLRHHLAEFNSPAAVHLSNSYQHLPYFPHALEVMLHDVLDSEVDNPPSSPEAALLPMVLSYLSSFEPYLDVVVNCTRKTELRSWRTLFSHLPPVSQLFSQSLTQGKLTTAAGYLLVLHAFEQESFQMREFGALLRLAAAAQDWELCKELARFLVGIDASGQTLRSTLHEAGIVELNTQQQNGLGNTAGLHTSRSGEVRNELTNGGEYVNLEPDRTNQTNGAGSRAAGTDYFALREEVK